MKFIRQYHDLTRWYSQLVIVMLIFFTSLVIIGCMSANPTTPGSIPETPTVQLSLEAEVKNGDPVPDFPLRTLDGETLQMSQFEGSVVVLYFWSTQISHALGISQASAAANNFGDEGLVVLGIDSFGESEDAVRAYAEQLDLKFTIILDSDQTISQLFAARPGMTVWIDVDGTIRSIIPNFTSTTLSREDIATRLEHYLNEP